MKTCPYCRSEIPAEASKCTGCGSWLNYKQAVGGIAPIISLLIGLISVVTLSYGHLTGLYRIVTQTDGASISLIQVGGGRDGPEDQGYIFVSAANTGVGAGVLNVTMWCPLWAEGEQQEHRVARLIASEPVSLLPGEVKGIRFIVEDTSGIGASDEEARRRYSVNGSTLDSGECRFEFADKHDDVEFRRAPILLP